MKKASSLQNIYTLQMERLLTLNTLEGKVYAFCLESNGITSNDVQSVASISVNCDGRGGSNCNWEQPFISSFSSCERLLKLSGRLENVFSERLRRRNDTRFPIPLDTCEILQFVMCNSCRFLSLVTCVKPSDPSLQQSLKESLIRNCNSEQFEGRFTRFLQSYAINSLMLGGRSGIDFKLVQ